MKKGDKLRVTDIDGLHEYVVRLSGGHERHDAPKNRGWVNGTILTLLYDPNPYDPYFHVHDGSGGWSVLKDFVEPLDETEAG